MDPRFMESQLGAGVLAKTEPGDAKAFVEGDSALHEALGLSEDQLQNLRDSALTLLSAGHLERAAQVARALLAMQDIHPAGSFVMSQALLLEGNPQRARLYIDVSLDLARALELTDLEAVIAAARDRMESEEPS